MSEAVVDDIVAVLPPLLQSLEAIGFIARHLNPPDFDRVMDAAGTPDQALQAVRSQLTDWPESCAQLRGPLEAAADAALAAFSGLREVRHGHGDLVSVFRALRYGPRAQEALYPLATKLPPVSEFFTDPALREDPNLRVRLAAPAHADTGIIHDHNEPGSRGGFSLYVPEYYTPDRAWPLVMALHGGSGNGRGFLWSWLRDARSHGAVLVAPTATGPVPAKNTWALMGEDSDISPAFSISCKRNGTSIPAGCC
jgi:phospholipase/carboxylesterase